MGIVVSANDLDLSLIILPRTVTHFAPLYVYGNQVRLSHLQ